LMLAKQTKKDMGVTGKGDWSATDETCERNSVPGRKRGCDRIVRGHPTESRACIKRNTGSTGEKKKREKRKFTGDR